MSGSGRAVEFRQDIQGLRAVAVLLVIADHSGVRWLTGGFVGVDVFFVVSGYLITLLLLKEAASTGRIRIGEFYARRARRILPAASLVIVVTMVYAAHEASLSRVRELRADGVWSAFFAANIHFSRLQTDYFAQGPEPSPFQHYWSLAVEEQFYLVWPLLLAVVLLAVARAASRDAMRTRVVTGLLVVIIAASLAWSVHQTMSAPATTYYSSPARAWELAVGALVATCEPRLTGLSALTRGGLGIGGLIAIGSASVLYGSDSAFPGWRALVPVLGAAALITAGVAGQSGPTRVLTLAPLTWLGALSYSLYLWHWPVLVLGPLSSPWSGPRATATLLAVTLVLSVATYYLVENPLRRQPFLRRGRRGLVLWPVTVSVVLVGATVAERQSEELLQARLNPVSGGVPTAEATTNAKGQPFPHTPPTLSPQLPIARRLGEALRAADDGSPVPLPLTNLPEPPDRPFPLPGRCIANSLETSPAEVCPLGRTDARPTMVVLGDSQAGEWLPAINQLGEADGYRVLPLIKLGCSPFDVPEVDGSGAYAWPCTEFRDWAAADIASLAPAVVIVGSEAMSPRMRAAPGRDLSETWVDGVSGLVDHLRGDGARVVVLADTPDLSFDPVDCLTSPHSRLQDCIGAPHPGLADANRTTRTAAEEAGAGYVDTVALLCLDGRCPMVVEDTVTYWDYAHVSPEWAAALAPYVTRLVDAQLAGLTASPTTGVRADAGRPSFRH